MKEVYIDKDEWYPVYMAIPSKTGYNFGKLCNIPDELLKEYEDAYDHFEAVQKKLAKEYEG